MSNSTHRSSGAEQVLFRRSQHVQGFAGTFLKLKFKLIYDYDYDVHRLEANMSNNWPIPLSKLDESGHQMVVF